jgi:hypothetical protein
MIRTIFAVVALLAFSAFGYANEALADPEPGLSTHELLIFLHQLLFVFWLGPDIGVFLWSGKVADPNLSVAQRLAAAKVMGMIDVVPRVAMSLMLTVGGLLSEYVGLDHPWWQMVGIVLLGPCWLALVLLTYFRQGTSFGQTLARYDVWFRWILMAVILASVTYSTVTGRLAPAPWVGWKLIIFAALLFVGAMMRLAIRPFVAGVVQMATQGPSAAANAGMAAGLKATKRWVPAMWGGLLLAALLGVWQPGSVEESAATPHEHELGGSHSG